MFIFDKFLDLLSNKKCYSCQKVWHFLCEECFNKEITYKNNCYVCKWFNKNWDIHKECKNNIYYDKVLILKHYHSKVMKKLIKDAKFYWVINIFYEFGEHLYKKFLLNEKIIKKDDYIIMSVSSNFLRKFKRWYNSSEVLSKYFSKISWIKHKKNIVLKCKNTRQQSKLSRKERLINLKGSFRINKKYIKIIKNKNIIIVDDVISTWTTLNEVSKILKQNWAKKIIWLILASD